MNKIIGDLPDMRDCLVIYSPEQQETKNITLWDIKEQAIKYKVDMNTVAFIIWLKVGAPSITRLKQLIEFFNK